MTLEEARALKEYLVEQSRRPRILRKTAGKAKLLSKLVIKSKHLKRKKREKVAGHWMKVAHEYAKEAAIPFRALIKGRRAGGLAERGISAASGVSHQHGVVKQRREAKKLVGKLRPYLPKPLGV